MIGWPKTSMFQFALSFLFFFYRFIANSNIIIQIVTQQSGSLWNIYFWLFVVDFLLSYELNRSQCSTEFQRFRSEQFSSTVTAALKRVYRLHYPKFENKLSVTVLIRSVYIGLNSKYQHLFNNHAVEKGVFLTNILFKRNIYKCARIMTKEKNWRPKRNSL